MSDDYVIALVGALLGIVLLGVATTELVLVYAGVIALASIHAYATIRVERGREE